METPTVILDGVPFRFVRRVLNNAPEHWSRWYVRVAYPDDPDAVRDAIHAAIVAHQPLWDCIEAGHPQRTATMDNPLGPPAQPIGCPQCFPQ